MYCYEMLRKAKKSKERQAQERVVVQVIVKKSILEIRDHFEQRNFFF